MSKETNPYVQFSYSNLKRKEEISKIDKASSSKPTNQHSFQIRFFSKPVLCLHCRDFIWGEGYIGYSCTNCSKSVHSKCKLFVSSSNCLNNDSTSINAITKSTLCSVEDWDLETVKEWLAVVNLNRYAEIFASYNITGSKLIKIDIYQLSAFRIRDNYHHSAILQARDELRFKSHKHQTYKQLEIDLEEAKSNLIKNQFKPEHHEFLVHSISNLTDCDLCKRPFLGIINQALQCQNCGLLTHRQCSFLGLPDCKLSPSRPIFNKHFIFGLSLVNSINQKEQIPLLLVKCFKSIEERSLISKEDLYDVYRLSSDTNELDRIKAQINDIGLEWIDLELYNLNTIASLVKTFLKELQDCIIPECLYEKLVNNVHSMSPEEFKFFIKNNLNPLNLRVLGYIMCHLIRVWTYQHQVKGCHYLPDKLFHIFRTVLLRPEWENINQIVYNVDSQNLVIQRLIVDYDWGIDLPEYKIRPKRPVNPSYSLESDLMINKHSNLRSTSKTITHFNPSTSSDTYKSNDYTQDSINENHWYWGSITQEDTFLILKNCPDGSYLVRESSDKSFDSPFTLCVIKSSIVKSIKIFKQNGSNGVYLYDIEKPCRFESVSALVAYYSRVSLKEFNRNLDLVLNYGVSKFKFGKTTDWTIDKLYSSFRDAFQEYEQLSKKFDNLEIEISNVKEDLNQKKLASEALEKIIDMYSKQIEQVDKVLNENLLKKTNAITTTRLLISQMMPTGLNGKKNESIEDDEVTRLDNLMKNNKDKLKNKCDEFLIKKENLSNDTSYLETVISQLQEELDLLRPELIELRKKRENYHMWLVQRGENDDKIQTKLKNLFKTDLKNSLKENSKLSISTDYLPINTEPIRDSFGFKTDEIEDEVSIHSDSTNWFMPDCNREEAINLLKSQPNGTYLVRRNSKPNSKYILSVINENEIKHFLIEENQTGCFIKSSKKLDDESSLSTFTATSNLDEEETIRFKTLKDLVIYYTKNQIRLNDVLLETVLTKPAFYNVKF